MGEGIVVRIIPGCPATVLVETEEDKELVKAALGDTECGCLVRTEAVAEELAEAAVEEAAAEVAEEAEVAAEVEAEEAPVCSLEPNVPWEESVCGVVAKEAGRQAADTVMVRLREEGVIA
ncbi:hypothetical protein ES703_55777 [subsurface metagenome]